MTIVSVTQFTPLVAEADDPILHAVRPNHR
jgi:hypothetical protein